MRKSLNRVLNLAAAAIARREADALSTEEKPRFVAGSIGPTNKTCSISPDVNDPAKRGITYDELVAAYDEQIEALIEGGVDALLIETIFDTLNAKAAIYAAEQVMERMGRRLPIMLSVTISDAAGRTLSGQTLDAFLASVSHADIFSVGLNCSFGAAQMKPYLKALASRAPYYDVDVCCKICCLVYSIDSCAISASIIEDFAAVAFSIVVVNESCAASKRF